MSGHVIPMLLILALHHLLISPVVAYTALSDHFLQLVPSGGADFDIDNGKLLAPILIPRVAGTPGQTAAQQHFVNFFAKELPKWNIEWFNSTSTTPVTGDKQVPFANLLFKREPPWVQQGQSNLLTLVAHYDSKIYPEGFIGATDSAVPCAILMHVARTLDKFLTQMHDEMAALGEGGTVPMDMGVQILLLDGEEAFKQWTDTDSLYGARALAETWENSVHPAMSFYRNPLDQISMFVLLDLLGSANPTVPSFFQTTHWAYKAMATIEGRMRKLGLLESVPQRPFLPDLEKETTTFYRGFIEDDHKPFMARGVPVLHVIASPFPKVWHTMDDDGAHLDMPTVRDWAKIVTAFALEWLDMMEVEPKEDGEAPVTS
ncbi:peptidase family M28-domain-containing protein [Annulohypoxylon maeteangense]|uniref:peptidase family M28-domain-containing protein n=1 Tax=Annulohypoxylon maeteangense TaxID=1927788 RepID=UPI0020079924|nr:peptidase family M28-domain-containing protein [Annulohypoxylon maeteangense]KAI0888205.1 peptidase family M28-domain-containing protein [Annulohypoxylon maeteangense]